MTTRRFLRFSLRGLLLAMFAIAVWCAFHANRGRYERSAKPAFQCIAPRSAVDVIDIVATLKRVCPSFAFYDVAPSGGAEALTMQALMVMSDAAIARWRGQGVDDEVLADGLSSLRFEIRDLPSTILGGALADGTVLIDLDAAGYGWFVDATPRTDREFDRIISWSQREATAGAAAEGADLLSVVMHEIGHVLGLDHDHGGPTNLMNDSIGLGMRRTPTVWDAAIVDFLYWTSQRRR